MSQGGFTVGVSELEWVRRLSERAASASGKLSILQELSDDFSITYVTADGQVSEKTRRPMARRFLFNSVDQLGASIDLAKSVFESESGGGVVIPAIFVSRSGVLLVWNLSGGSGRGRDRSVYYVQSHDEFKVFYGDTENLNQKQFLRLLRVNLKSALGELGNTLIPAISSIRWETGSRGASQVGSGRESMGREINSEIRSLAGEIPDEIVLNLRLSRDPATPGRYPVRCVLQIDSQQQTFSLLPMAGELDRAWSDFEKDLFDIVSDISGDIPVILGGVERSGNHNTEEE
jgi:hypothetical protein